MERLFLHHVSEKIVLIPARKRYKLSGEDEHNQLTGGMSVCTSPLVQQYTQTNKSAHPGNQQQREIFGHSFPLFTQPTSWSAIDAGHVSLEACEGMKNLSRFRINAIVE